MLLFLETSHAGVREAIRRLVEGDTLFNTIALDELDGARYFVELREDGLVVGIKHRVSKQVFLDAGLTAILEKSFGAGNVNFNDDSYDAVIKLAPVKQSEDGLLVVEPAPGKDLMERAASLRSLCLYSVMSDAVEKFSQSKTLPVLRLPYRDDGEAVYIGSMKESIFVTFTIVVDDKDNWLLAKAFLKEFEDAKKHERSISSSVGITVTNKKLPLELSGTPAGVIKENPETSNLFFVTFVLLSKHIDQKSLLKTTTHLINFRSNFFYHLACTKSYLHMKMRARVTSLLKVLNRAKTDTTGKSTTQLK